MRKQTKLVAVLSAAALLAMGASMTSFAAGWEKDDAGIWHYYDSDDEMVTDEWQKDGSKWFYLNEDGNMLTDAWVDDDYYVGEDGAMLVNQWKKTYANEDQDSPDSEGERWFYFGSKGKKVVDDVRKINGKTYKFDGDGKMLYGWQGDNTVAYYYGTEDEGWRAENQWLWLEKPGLLDEDDTDDGQEIVLGCTENDACDDEGWYWFQSSGKAYNDSGKRKINGKYYIFNEDGQMLYEWINNDTAVTHASNAILDAEDATASDADKVLYYEVVEDGSRVTGWRELDGSYALSTENDTDWYYIDKGEIKHAAGSDLVIGLTDDGDRVFRMRDKIKESGNKYFCFNENGQMQTGLQYIQGEGFFYFDENGYMKTGKIASVECEDDDYAFYFTTSNGKNGVGYTGEKDGYLYFNGKRLEADDDYRFYYVKGNVYLVNTKGKVQKATSSSGKKYSDIENGFFANMEDVIIKTNNKGVIDEVIYPSGSSNTVLDDANIIADIQATSTTDDKAVSSTNYVTIPSIELLDNVFTYVVTGNGIMADWR